MLLHPAHPCFCMSQDLLPNPLPAALTPVLLPLLEKTSASAANSPVKLAGAITVARQLPAEQWHTWQHSGPHLPVKDTSSPI